MSDWTGIVGAAIGAIGALAGGIIAQRLGIKSTENTRRAVYLREQLQKVYSPLQFYNEAQKALEDSIKRLTTIQDYDEFSKTKVLLIQNDIHAKIRANAVLIANLILDNSGWIDIEDMKVFSRVLRDYEQLA